MKLKNKFFLALGFALSANVFAQSSDSLGPGSTPGSTDFGYIYNGATWDRRGSADSVTNAASTTQRAAAIASVSYPGGAVTWLASAARTATQTLADQTSYFARGILVNCNVTVAPGVETLTLSIQRKDSLSGVYTTIAANTATTATGMITLKVSPNFIVVAASATGHTANDILGPTWRLVMTHSAAASWTYSCSYTLLSNQ